MRDLMYPLGVSVAVAANKTTRSDARSRRRQRFRRPMAEETTSVTCRHHDGGGGCEHRDRWALLHFLICLASVQSLVSNPALILLASTVSVH